MKLIDPSQRINVLWDSDDGTRYTEAMTIRRLLAVMSDDEVETIELVRCGECVHAPKCYGDIAMVSKGGGEKYCPVEYCSMGERRTDDEAD